jgi:hypothetical protein
MPQSEPRFRRFVHDNALSLAALGLFLFSIVGQAIAGFRVAAEEAREHVDTPPTFGAYLLSGDFVEATFENWESEFLQIALFVVLTKFLHQRGSSESKPFSRESVDEDPRKRRRDRRVPWPVARGGVVLALYERSLSIALFALFAISFALHAIGGAQKHNEEALRHGGETTSTLAYVGTSQFWFESFQNWQSEFLAVAALVVLSIFLRERGSSQSKPVAAPHAQTGEA